MSRKEAREAAMQLIYQAKINETNAEETLNNYYEYVERKLSPEDREYIDDCVSGVEKHINDIDSYIVKFSKDWKIGRIAKVDLAVMRLAVYEMLYRSDVPNVVAVNEAVELAKKFGGENSSSFINGILGNIIKEINSNA